MPIEAITSVLIGACVVAGTLLDAEGSRESNRLHLRAYRWQRLGNWLPLGIAYAAFYMARYNIAAGNVAALRAQLHLTTTDMGWVISAGSWTYALSAPLTGHVTDRIGGQRGMVLACAGAGACNLLLGLAFSHGRVSEATFCFLFALNQGFQGFGTAAVVKINAMWYGPSERGLFSGIFNMLVVSGYYLALGSGDSIVATLGWPYLFYIPSLLLGAMGLVSLLWIRNSPPTSEAPSMPSTTPFCDTQHSGLLSLLRNPTVWGYLGAIFCLSWARDGLLNWMYSYFDAVRASPLSPSDHALLGGAWTLGGFVGGVLCGWISDHLFRGQRMPPIVLFSAMQGMVVYGMYMAAPHVSMAVLALLLFVASVFLLGSYTMLSYTIPTDLPVEIAASAGGLFTTAAYMATGLSGVVMGAVVGDYGYDFWVASLVLASIASGLCTYVGAQYARSHASLACETECTPLQTKAVDRRRASLVNTQGDFIAVPILDSSTKEVTET
ncbi:hypothetical protein SPRG_13628 [Saprolegnia parasitica CBS 223.65]|uniref:Major facilitator superfamily (MFS) profile domain-containing protein n=1 Tax=Saprolegnia parasitica (strain CBS 223.65) TaxID=695850 RepID=A0A067C1Y8_SAPPC|nr:hypothetical protein SPRG_13628 [Saprolegnia parasitica CBS 223.65]KDO20812.1 hypothetical protein SPRG_13628 [Saprolegnia parasitica CBS 223.65]|eukprot:XP_012208471.1 hypothetical protein SPRG_13628 [Saprolegnia parasitica CBS 223.65]